MSRPPRHQKLAIVSCVVPPSPSGQAMVLFRLLRDLSGDDYCLISVDSAAKQSPNKVADSLPTRYYPLHPPEFRIRRKPLLSPKLAYHGINFLLKVLHRARRIKTILKLEKCDAVVGCTGDVHDLPAAYLAARWAGLPFYVYAFDYYSFQCKGVYPPAFAVTSRLERHILKGAARVIVPNQFLREEYYRRYRIDPVVIHNPIDAPQELSPASSAVATKSADDSLWDRLKARTRRWVTGRRSLPPTPPREVKLVYTGSVYAAQIDAFRNLIVALKQLGRPDIKLHIYTSQPLEPLVEAGICGPVVYHPHVSLAESLEVQRTADILFLPLAFESAFPEIIHTSSPGKLGEYLASGRPILAHAPAESFLAWYFKQYECGMIVDRPDPLLLGQAIVDLLKGEATRDRLVKNARACAAEFHIDHARSRLLEVLAA